MMAWEGLTGSLAEGSNGHGQQSHGQQQLVAFAAQLGFGSSRVPGATSLLNERMCL